MLPLLLLRLLARLATQARGVAGLIDDSFALLRTPGKSPALTVTVALQLLKTALEATGDYTVRKQGISHYSQQAYVI